MHVSVDKLTHYEIVSETREPWDSFLVCTLRGCDWDENVTDTSLVTVLYHATEHDRRSHSD